MMKKKKQLNNYWGMLHSNFSNQVNKQTPDSSNSPLYQYSTVLWSHDCYGHMVKSVAVVTAA